MLFGNAKGMRDFIFITLMNLPHASAIIFLLSTSVIMAQEISSKFPYESKFIEVHGSKMHYIDEYADSSNPDQMIFLFIHGNPTSNYLWRNIIPYVRNYGRAVAPDLIGMGKSDKPDIDYTFHDHYKYLDKFIRQLDLKNIVLVIHDWGSGLGFHYAFQNKNNIKGIVFMEAITQTMKWKDTDLITRYFLRRFRDERKGHKMIAEKNMFINKFLFKVGVKRKLTDVEKEYYNSPYPTIESRKPIEVWPKEIPIDRNPEETHIVISNYAQWLKETETPMLLIYAKPGMIVKKTDVIRLESDIKNITSIYIGKGKHYIQEDHPHEIGQAIAEWAAEIDAF